MEALESAASGPSGARFAGIGTADLLPAVAGAVPLSEILGALSHALDLTEGQPAGHCVRCCWVGVHVGRAMGLSKAQVEELYYAILLKDLGCSSDAARICQLYLTDGRGFKRDVKMVGDWLPAVLGFVLSHTGLKAGLAERFPAILDIVQNGGEIVGELIETRCQRGAGIARQLRFPETVAQGIQALDEHWDGGGKPFGLAGAAIPIYARIALLAQVVDVFHTAAGREAAGREAALREVRRRAGSWFDPQVAAAFESIAAERGFWGVLGSVDLEAAIFALEPAWRSAIADDDYLDDIALAFANVVDSKSPFTRGHSDRVALYADLIAEELGFDRAQRRRLRRAGLQHDIGKLGVSNEILDKPGKLDEAEWVAMRNHAVHSEAILSRIGVFEELARIGGAHHERLDGKGYPRGLRAEQICPATRVITAADVFDALTADRPYRAAMPAARALEIMERDVGTAFDPACFGALKKALARIEPEPPA